MRSLHTIITLGGLALGGLAACGVNQTPEPEPSSELPSCIPNRDGVITADELPVALGATVTTYTSPPNVTREIDLSGERAWKLDDERADDLIVAIGPVALGPQWYANQFPAGRFVVDAGGGLDGIYHQDDQALWLDGTASQEADLTLVRYADPVALLRFPLLDGDVATTIAQIPAGVVGGLPFIGTDEVTLDVTAGDRLAVPYVVFSPVTRVRTQIVRRPSTGQLSVSKRTTLFLFECFGEVGRAESRPDEPAADFTTAAYVRRFALGRNLTTQGAP